MRRGFSLIEVVIVLVIMAALAAIAVPRLSSSHAGSRLDATQRRVLGIFESAAETARARGGGVTLQFSTADDTVTLREGTSAAPGAVIESVRFSEEPYRADMLAVSALTPAGRIDVDAFGVYSDKARVSFRVGQTTRVVNLIGPVKGAVVVPEEDDDGALLEINLLGIGIRL